MKQDLKICVGMIAGTHGVRGLVRLRSFTEDPEAIGSYDPITDEDGERHFDLEIKSAAKDYYVASIKGVSSKEAADALRGTKLFVARSVLPKIGKREYYEADLVGLAVKDNKGQAHGEVQAVHNYGGGPFLEIGKTKSATTMLPFTDVFVPMIDVKAGSLTINPPEGWLDTPKKKANKQEASA